MIETMVVQRATYCASSAEEPMMDGEIIFGVLYSAGRIVVKMYDTGGFEPVFFFCAS